MKTGVLNKESDFPNTTEQSIKVGTVFAVQYEGH